MSVKALFTDQQPPAKWQELGNGQVDIIICLNEEIVTIDKVGEGDYQEALEYDFNQFREDLGRISRKDVETNPRKYLDYEPQKEPTVEELRETVRSQQEQIDMLGECIIEMSELVYE